MVPALALEDITVTFVSHDGGRYTAIKETTLQVAPGEFVSVVGPSGCGKSTLLKIVAGILRPTEGKVTTRGRIAALLELGAGFHPELTGRENVYLNGSILGLSRREIDSKFDEMDQREETPMASARASWS